MRPYEVDVPVRVMLWTRPDCLRQQFEVIKKAAPSILFLISDGGRNEKEMAKIRESRKIYDEIDWECTVHKLYFDENQGMYTMMKNTRELVWGTVDRCIFLEDDYVPSVSYFKFCAELLEKYKDDERIHMITGNNPFGTYDAPKDQDYFFTENGWSIWGTATWKRCAENREYPLLYKDDEYIKSCLKANLNDFWYKKAEGYCSGELVDGHVPGGEYFHATNSALFHRLSIVPTKNLIKNIGYAGEHSNYKKASDAPSYMGVDTYELDFPLRHPKYVIDDKNYSNMYDRLLGHDKKGPVGKLIAKLKMSVMLLKNGKILSVLKRKISGRKKEER